MEISEHTLTRGMKDADSLKQINKEMCKDTGTVYANVSIEDDVHTHEAMDTNDKKPRVNQLDKCLPESWQLSNGNYTSVYPTGNLLSFTRNIQRMVRPESDYIKAYPKHRQFGKSSDRGTKYNLARRYTSKPYGKIKTSHYKDISFGNVSNKVGLGFANRNSRNTFVSMASNKAQCIAKGDTFLYNKYNAEKGASNFRNSARKGCAGLLNANRNNSRYLDDSGSEADENGGLADSNAGDAKSKDITWEDSNSEDSDSGEGTRSASSVTSEVCYSKLDSENKESKYVEDGSTNDNTECHDECDLSSDVADDTECSIDFENISGSVFWSEDASNDNHIDGVDDVDNHDDNEDTTFCENTISEDSRGLCVQNCAPVNTEHSCKHYSPSYVGLLTGQSATNNDGENATFLDDTEGILQHSVFHETMAPILTRGRSSLPLKIMSLTSNNFDSYRRMFEAFKTRIFPGTNEKDDENCDRRKDGGCLRRCVSIADNDSTSENSRLLQLSSSESEICKKDNIDDNERSKHNSVKEVEDTHRILPAWCDWEAEFDCMNSDDVESRPPDDHKGVKCAMVENKTKGDNLGKADAKCAMVENKTKGDNLGKADAGQNRHDLDKQLKAAKSKHFSCCMQKKGSRTSLANQGMQFNNINKSTTDGEKKKKLINFKFQGPRKHDRNQYLNKALCNVFADNNLSNEEGQDIVLHQTSIITVMAGKSVSRLSVESQKIVLALHTKDIDSVQQAEDSQTMEIIQKDIANENASGMRKDTLENIDSSQEAEDSRDTDCQQALDIRKVITNNSNGEGSKDRNFSEVKKQAQPCDDSVYDTEEAVASLADFKTSPEMKQDDSNNTLDSVDHEYSAVDAHHRPLGTEHSLEQTQKEKTKKTDNGAHTRLPEVDNNAQDTVRSSAETPTDNVNRHTKSEGKETEPDTRGRYLPGEQLPSITSQKSTVRPKETKRLFGDVFRATPRGDTNNESRMGRLTTTIPTVFKVMSELSPMSVSSPEVTIVRPKYTVFGSKSRKRRMDTRKGRKAKDHGHQQKKWLGKHYTPVAKPRKASSRSKSEKSASGKSLTNVPHIHTTCMLPIPAVAASREHKCYLKYHNRDTMRNIGHTYNTDLAMGQTATGSTRPSMVKSDESLTADVDEMHQGDPGFAAEDLETDVFIFNKNDYYYYFQPMRSPRWPDSEADTSICSPGRSMSDSKDTHSVSDIYFIDNPRRGVSRAEITKSSPNNSQSLTDIYFSNSRGKYGLLDETTYSEAEYDHNDADTLRDEDVISTEGSLNSNTDVIDHSSSGLHNNRNEDTIFYDDCLLELINKRTVVNTANPDTSTICCRDDAGSEMNNSVSNLQQTLTISDLLAESICLPADDSNLLDTILPEVSLIQEAERNVRNKHKSKRKRVKRSSDQNSPTPPHGEPCLGENENTENMQPGYNLDKTSSSQEIMAGGNVAQSLVIAATEDNTFETKLVNYEYHNFGKFRESDKDHTVAVKSSNLESNNPWHADQPSEMPEYSRTAESKQFTDNEPNSYAIQDTNNDELCSQHSYDSEDKDKEDDVYEVDSNLKHKVALLLQRIEDTNCIKIVSTQEFYKKKHGAASFINDLAKMIDYNLERCNEKPQEKIVNGHNVAAKELVVACTPRKVPKKEKTYTQDEEQRAKKAQDSAVEKKQVYESKHKREQRLSDGHTDGDERKGVKTMGCLARHVRKQISAMHRYNDDESMALLKQDNTLCAYTNERRSTKEIKELKTTGKSMSKGSPRNECKRVHEESGIVQRLVESAAEEYDKNYNINLACCAGESGQALGSNSYNKSQTTESKNVPPNGIYCNLHNKRIYSDCSDGSIKTVSNKSDYNREDKSKKVNADDYYDSDSNNMGLISSTSSVLTSRIAETVPKCQPRLKEDLQRDGVHTKKNTSGGKIRQHQPSAFRKPQKVRKSHQNPGVVTQQGNTQTEYTRTNVLLAKNSENDTPSEGVKNESNGKNANLFSGLQDSSRLNVANFPLKNTSSDISYWEEDVMRDTKVDAGSPQSDEQKLDYEYEEYKRHHRFIDVSSHTKEKVLKTTGTQYDLPAAVPVQESKHMYTLARGGDNSTDIYYTQDKLSLSGSDQDLSDGSSSYQIQNEETPLSDREIPRVPSCTKCQKISPLFARPDYCKPKKNVTFQEVESRESNVKSTSKQTDITPNDDLISDTRRTADTQGNRVPNNEYSSRVYRTNATVSSSQETNHEKRSTKTTPPESGEQSPKSCLYPWDNNDDGEISRPGFVSYIHKHRRQKSESAATKEISSTDTVCSQQSKDNKPTCGNTKGTITHEPSRKDDQHSRIGISKKESQSDKGILQIPNTFQRTDMTNVGFRRCTGQNKSPTSGHHAKEDCVKHSIASLNSNDRSDGSVQSYANVVNKPMFSLTGSPKASVEYTISGTSKLDESNKKKVIPDPRVDLGSSYLQRGHSGHEVAKKALAVVSSGFKVAGNKPGVAKGGLTVTRNEHGVARSGFKVARSDPSVARNDQFFQDTPRQTWKIGSLSTPNKVDSSKRRPISPFNLTPTRDWEVNASRSVSCHDVRVNSQTKHVIQESDEKPPKQRSNYMGSYPCPTCLDPKRNYKDVLHNHILGSEIVVAPTFLSSKSLRGNSKDSESLMSGKSLRGISKDSESPVFSKFSRGISKDRESVMSGKSLRGISKDRESVMPGKSLRGISKDSESPVFSKSLRGISKDSESLMFSTSFRGNPRDNDDLLGTREYSSGGFFIPENDDEDYGHTKYLTGLDSLAERFSPELKRRNSLPDYDFQERYHNSHSPSPCEHPMVTSRQDLFANTEARNAWEGEQKGVVRPQRETAWEKTYLENKQLELQKGFQNYWGERMKMRKEEFERLRQEYRTSLRSTEDAVLFKNHNLAGKRSVVSGKVPRKTVRSGVDKSPRRTTLSEAGKTHRKKTAPEIDKFSRKTPRSSMVAQPSLRLSDVDVEVHRVDSSTVQRMRNQSKQRDIELPRHETPEFPGKDLFKFAHKALLGSTFQTERLPSTALIQEQPKDVHENRSPGLLSRIINSFSRSDRVRFMTGKGNEVRSGSSEPKQSLLGTDGSGEGFVSVADMRGQVAKTSHYCANTGIHHRNKRRLSHSPQMSILGLRDLRSDYNQNMNYNAKSRAKQYVRKTNNRRVYNNIRSVRNSVIKKTMSTLLGKHFDIPVLFPLKTMLYPLKSMLYPLKSMLYQLKTMLYPLKSMLCPLKSMLFKCKSNEAMLFPLKSMLFPFKSNEVSNIPKKPKQSPPCILAAPGNDAIEMHSSKLHNSFTKAKTDTRVAGNVPTPLATTGRTVILTLLLLAMFLSMLCSDFSMRPALSIVEQTSAHLERHSREAPLSLSNAVSVFESM